PSAGRTHGADWSWYPADGRRCGRATGTTASGQPAAGETTGGEAGMVATAEQMEADGLIMEAVITPEGRGDPYPRYRQLRETAPVHKSSLGPVLFLTRYEDTNFLLRDNRFGKGDPADERRMVFNPSVRPRPPSVLATSMLFVNPPDHT